MFGKRKQEPPTVQSGWTVRVSPATRGKEHMNYSTGRTEWRMTPVEGEVAVMLLLHGVKKMTYGTLKITSHDFEDKITTMKAEAENKASALNAVEVY